MKRFLMVLACLGALFFGVQAHAQDKSEKAFEAIRGFYAARDYKTVWTARDRFTPRARAFPKILEGAKVHGLDPAAYGSPRMLALLEEQGTPATPEEWQKAELEWTYALWSYATDLMGEPVDALTLASLVDGDIEDNLQALGPDQPLYTALKEKLATLDTRMAARAAEAAAAGKPLQKPAALEFGRREFKPGMQSPSVPALRAAMQDYGALPVPESAGNLEKNTYDESLVKAVSRFQEEHGLASDGKIGSATLALLNRTPEAERMQVVANMQRLREPHRRLREDRRIEVSIARYWLTGYDNGHEAISMPVIVGKPTRQTISFRTEISGVRLNPTWTVPPTIKKEDFIPMLVKDPAKLVRMHGVKVVHDGKNVDPQAVEWSKMSPKELSQVKFWRPAGDGNPLGRYRVIMDNPYDIYLHDTNHPDLFESSMRAQSSGCVRVSRPEDLANFILSFKQGWEAQKTKEIVKSGRTTDLLMENKIPIYLDYMTAWLNSRNQVVLGVDVYGLDKPRYDGLVNSVLTTQRNAQKIFDRGREILTPELQEAQHRDPVLIQSAN